MKRFEIKKWLGEKGLTQRQIAREAGVSDGLVSLTLRGERRGEAVLRTLRGHECPEEFLVAATKENL